MVAATATPKGSTTYADPTRVMTVVCASTGTVPGTGKLHGSYGHDTSSRPCSIGRTIHQHQYGVAPRIPASAVVTSNAPASAASITPPGSPRASILPNCFHETAVAILLLMLMRSAGVPKRGSSAFASTAASCALSWSTPAVPQARQFPFILQAHCCFGNDLTRITTGIGNTCLHLLQSPPACEQRLDCRGQAKRDPWQ